MFLHKGGTTMNAYLDIETTGLSCYSDEITVVGIGLSDMSEFRVIQLFDDDVSAVAVRRLLRGVSTLYTYNGSRFDLPFIRHHLGVDVEGLATHHDLMLDCWQRGLYGGFKAVERTLGIRRQLTEVNGLQAILLWQEYKQRNDLKSLETLLAYNHEDVINLAALQEKLNV